MIGLFCGLSETYSWIAKVLTDPMLETLAVHCMQDIVLVHGKNKYVKQS